MTAAPEKTRIMTPKEQLQDCEAEKKDYDARRATALVRDHYPDMIDRLVRHVT